MALSGAAFLCLILLIIAFILFARSHKKQKVIMVVLLSQFFNFQLINLCYKEEELLLAAEWSDDELDETVDSDDGSGYYFSS